MRLGALRRSTRSDVSQTSDAGGLTRRAPALKGSDASVSGESRSRVSLESGGGASGALEGPRGAVTQRILEQIRMGRTVCAISVTTGISEAFVSVLLEHYGRPGMLDNAGSLYSLRLGACHTKDVSDEVRVAYAGYPLVIWDGIRSSGFGQ